MVLPMVGPWIQTYEFRPLGEDATELRIRIQRLRGRQRLLWQLMRRSLAKGMRANARPPPSDPKRSNAAVCPTGISLTGPLEPGTHEPSLGPQFQQIDTPQHSRHLGRHGQRSGTGDAVSTRKAVSLDGEVTPLHRFDDWLLAAPSSASSRGSRSSWSIETAQNRQSALLFRYLGDWT
jgi:hypothetical protein